MGYGTRSGSFAAVADGRLIENGDVDSCVTIKCFQNFISTAMYNLPEVVEVPIRIEVVRIQPSASQFGFCLHILSLLCRVANLEWSIQ